MSTEAERTPLLGAADGDGASPSNDGLRRVADSLPLSVWLIATIEMCERFAHFGALGPMQNYIQNPRNDSLRPGGIGRAPSAIISMLV
jgi:proton-dependent oligopeptide transporter, POT family